MSPRAERAQTDPAQAARLFAALGDPTRLRIVARLSAEGPLTIATLTDGAPVTRQAVTKHLRLLVGAGLVRDVGRRGQRQRAWALAPGRLADAQRYLDHVSRRWDDALKRLATLVEA